MSKEPRFHLGLILAGTRWIRRPFSWIIMCLQKHDWSEILIRFLYFIMSNSDQLLEYYSFDFCVFNVCLLCVYFMFNCMLDVCLLYAYFMFTVCFLKVYYMFAVYLVYVYFVVCYTVHVVVFCFILVACLLCLLLLYLLFCCCMIFYCSDL